jgi:DNA-binding SARP family transcriptional activator
MEGHLGVKIEENILYVQMLGGFSLSWKGHSIGGTKSRESQFLYLMQLLLHNRENGVSRDRLEEILFEDRDILNPHHAIRTIIYNAKQKLKASGLPSVNYIELRNGVFYWTDQIPVVEDATEFERLYREAEAATDENRKRALYLEACQCYTGEFLPSQAAVLWVSQEARRYRGLFYDCVEKAVPLLRSQKRYPEMEALGKYAAKISPLADWESVTMEALVSMGRQEDAWKLYDDTVDFYLQEQGLRPSRRLMDTLEQLGNRMEHHREALDAIQEDLSENRQEAEALGGYLCSYPVFRGIYRMIQRMMERGGQSACLMLCTIVDSKGRPMKEGAGLEELSKRLGETLRCSVRHGDAINRYRSGQYLVLLVNTTSESCNIIQRRIDEKAAQGNQRIHVRYKVNVITCSGNTYGRSSS